MDGRWYGRRWTGIQADALSPVDEAHPSWTAHARSMTTLAPLELMVVSFPANQLSDGIVATLNGLNKSDEMRIVDVVVVHTDVAGWACAVELSEVSGLRGDLAALSRLATGLIIETDVDEVASLVGTETDTLVVLLEHRWVHDLACQVAALSGTILSLKHIPGLPAGAAVAIHSSR